MRLDRSCLDWSVGGGVALVTPLVVAVVAGLVVLPHCLLHHHHLPLILTISSKPTNFSFLTKFKSVFFQEIVNIFLLNTFSFCGWLGWDLTILSSQQRVDKMGGNIILLVVMFVMISVMISVMIAVVISLVSVEGKSVDEGLLQSWRQGLTVSRGKTNQSEEN